MLCQFFCNSLHCSTHIYIKGLGSTDISADIDDSTLSRIYIGDVKCDVMCHIMGVITLYLLTSANRNYPICVASPKVAKVSTVADCCVSLSPTVLLTNVANVNNPLDVYCFLSR